MKDQSTYEMLTVFGCCTLLGLELIGFSSWYFVRVSQNPYQVFKQTLVVNIPLAIFILIIAIITGITTTKKRKELGITLPESRSFIEYLKLSRTWILLLGVVVMPLVLFLMVWLQLHYPSTRGMARRTSSNINIMVILLGLGPLLILLGLGGLAYYAVKRFIWKDS